MFNSTEIKKKYLKDLGPWRNKTLDYLYIKEKYPKNIIWFYSKISKTQIKEIFI